MRCSCGEYEGFTLFFGVDGLKLSGKGASLGCSWVCQTNVVEYTYPKSRVGRRNAAFPFFQNSLPTWNKFLVVGTVACCIVKNRQRRCSNWINCAQTIQKRLKVPKIGGLFYTLCVANSGWRKQNPTSFTDGCGRFLILLNLFLIIPVFLIVCFVSVRGTHSANY